ncbi:small subunit ribosomal protein S18e [Nematocida parisii]|uniref:Ribosomal protein S18 n=1 Tax=Nematocida parisii (strain ERTm3) TaxID=935791 RepID=I3EK99_NEMP3|nr:ribosomal protein S18 [Nematocida parisii ERTm1]EIJ89646.1 ribosomal protein S18 [Nematocida parisii ERTm3]KAI5126819.1 small subunit ribosomal protein S18e [Nematocida parisii]KAI5165980.1 small subunit ribosomal protein S18e [Nematocida sp. AWRm79]KAI5183059.1 small subunit ribosomal protein S18e [Nematocida sp. AWRm78]OAG29848.1 small subunit ribosomal protein S18e [Nematocida sp. ERTm5]|eukprot:XP_013058649.1 ribosomal protein S18 [Nematocida parisii ERTm1]
MTLRFTESAQMQDIIRMYNTNINGRSTIIRSLTGIRGIGLRVSTLLCKKANIDTSLRAGQVEQEKLDVISKILESPQSYGVPDWMLNRQKDPLTGEYKQLIANQVEADYRLYLERAKRVKHIRGLRLLKGLKVNGQRTKSNGRRGKTVGVSKKK